MSHVSEGTQCKLCPPMLRRVVGHACPFMLSFEGVPGVFKDSSPHDRRDCASFRRLDLMLENAVVGVIRVPCQSMAIALRKECPATRPRPLRPPIPPAPFGLPHLRQSTKAGALMADVP